MTVTACLRA